MTDSQGTITVGACTLLLARTMTLLASKKGRIPDWEHWRPAALPENSPQMGQVLQGWAIA